MANVLLDSLKTGGPLLLVAIGAATISMGEKLLIEIGGVTLIVIGLYIEFSNYHQSKIKQIGNGRRNKTK